MYGPFLILMASLSITSGYLGYFNGPVPSVEVWRVAFIVLSGAFVFVGVRAVLAGARVSLEHMGGDWSVLKAANKPPTLHR